MPPSTPSDWSRGVVGCLSSVSAPSWHEHEVGEGAADVDADAIAASRGTRAGYTGCPPGGKTSAVLDFNGRKANIGSPGGPAWGDDESIMTKRLRVGMVALLAAVALVAGPMAGGAAWAKKSKIKCKIDGETFKTNARAGGAGGAYEPGTAMLILAGGRAKYHGRSPATVEVDLRTLDWHPPVGAGLDDRDVSAGRPRQRDVVLDPQDQGRQPRRKQALGGRRRHDDHHELRRHAYQGYGRGDHSSARRVRTHPPSSRIASSPFCSTASPFSRVRRFVRLTGPPRLTPGRAVVLWCGHVVAAVSRLGAPGGRGRVAGGDGERAPHRRSARSHGARGGASPGSVRVRAGSRRARRPRR